MTQKRFFARWTDRQDGQDLYDVLDSETNEFALERQPYHVANDHARKLNDEPEAQGEWALAWTVPLYTRELVKLQRVDEVVILCDPDEATLSDAEQDGFVVVEKVRRPPPVFEYDARIGAKSWEAKPK